MMSDEECVCCNGLSLLGVGGGAFGRQGGREPVVTGSSRGGGTDIFLLYLIYSLSATFRVYRVLQMLS